MRRGSSETLILGYAVTARSGRWKICAACSGSGSAMDTPGAVDSEDGGGWHRRA